MFTIFLCPLDTDIVSLLHTPAQEVAVLLLQAGCQPPLKLQEEETDPYPVAICGACFCIWLRSAWLQHIYSIIVQFKISKILFILFYLCFLSCSALSSLSTTVHMTHYCFIGICHKTQSNIIIHWSPVCSHLVNSSPTLSVIFGENKK